MFTAATRAFRPAMALGRRATSSVNDTFVLLTATGKDRVGIVSDVSKAILEHGGNIAESRMMRMGGDFTIMMRFSCPSASVSAFAHEVTGIPNTKCYMHEVPKSTFSVSPTPQYKAKFKLEGANEPGLIFKLSDLFRQHSLRIEQLSSETVSAPMGGTTLFVLDGIVECDTPVDEERLHNEVEQLANQLNMDITLSEASEAEQHCLDIRFDHLESKQEAEAKA